MSLSAQPAACSTALSFKDRMPSQMHITCMGGSAPDDIVGGVPWHHLVRPHVAIEAALQILQPAPEALQKTSGVSCTPWNLNRLTKCHATAGKPGMCYARYSNRCLALVHPHTSSAKTNVGVKHIAGHSSPGVWAARPLERSLCGSAPRECLERCQSRSHCSALGPAQARRAPPACLPCTQAGSILSAVQGLVHEWIAAIRQWHATAACQVLRGQSWRSAGLVPQHLLLS